MSDEMPALSELLRNKELWRHFVQLVSARRSANYDTIDSLSVRADIDSLIFEDNEILKLFPSKVIDCLPKPAPLTRKALCFMTYIESAMLFTARE
jgi:hypothetical protein